MKQYKMKKEEHHHEVREPAVAYGVADNNNIFSLISKVKNGVRFPVFKKIVDNSAFNINEWSNFLHLSERTMQRYKKESKTFDPIYSEKIFEITMLFNFGKDVFGNDNNFNTWLQTNNVALGGIAPKELLDNAFGIRLVKDELTRIQHGILA